MRLQDALDRINDLGTMNSTVEVVMVTDCHDGLADHFDILDITEDITTGTVQIRTCPACKRPGGQP